MDHVTYTKIPAATLTEWIRQAQAGDVAARNRVIHHHLRLVAQQATQAARRASRMDLLQDLIQAGVIGGRAKTGGLMRAIELFDPSLGFAFSTYAMRWIRSGVQEGLAAVVHAEPRRAVTTRRRVQRAAERFRVQHGRDPSTAELAPLVHYRGRQLTEEQIREFLCPVRTEVLPDDDALGNGHTEGTTAAALDGEREARDLRAAVDSLPTNLRAVVTRLYGLDGSEAETRTAVGASMGLVRQRIGQLEAQALARLREALG